MLNFCRGVYELKHTYFRFHMKHAYEGGIKVCINGPGHMTKMAAMAIFIEKLLKLFFSRTRRSMILKLGMKHQGEELYNV